MNNFERIKQMSIEEMALFLWQARSSDCGINPFNECKNCECNGFCQNGYLITNIEQWLESEE